MMLPVREMRDYAGDSFTIPRCVPRLYTWRELFDIRVYETSGAIIVCMRERAGESVYYVDAGK